MISIAIKDLTDYIFGQSPMYNAPDIRELLRINTYGSYVHTFTNILKKSLKELELKCPLQIMGKVINVSGSDFTYTFKSNFDAYIAGDKGITDKELELVPLSIVSFSFGLLYYPRRVDYFAPVARFKTGGIVTINYTTRYPVTWNSDKSTDDFTDAAKIYGMSEDLGGVFTFFVTMVEYNTCIYLRDQKAQMNFQELPLEILQMIDTRIGELEQQLNDFYSNPAYYSFSFM